MITITLNGKPRELEGAMSVAALLETLDINPVQVAVAVNGEVVPRSEWAATTVDDGDTVEVVRAVGGGSAAGKEPLFMDALLLLLVFAAGVAAATQILVNGAMGEERGVPEALLVSVTVTYGSALAIMLGRFFIVGRLNLETPTSGLVYLLPLAVIATIALVAIVGGLHWYYLLGGLAGTMIVATVALTGPRIGIGTTSAVLVAGQMIGAVVYDHLALLGQAKDPIDAAKIAGGLLIVGGVVLIRGV
ncbi:MAG TPA: sulfur carrier protein ThiS [Methylomirabilota bacterium]|nr:sulfur carrier protein ThiS [Methylomirabilota bacterium]